MSSLKSRTDNAEASHPPPVSDDCPCGKEHREGGHHLRMEVEGEARWR